MREACSIGDLWISTKCGDQTPLRGLVLVPLSAACMIIITAWHSRRFWRNIELTVPSICARQERRHRKRVRNSCVCGKDIRIEVIEAHKTSDLSDSQPTKGNIEGGLSTIEEKALGNLEKIGRRAKYIDALAAAEAPAQGAGLYFMDTSSAAAECITLMAAAGYVIHTFPTDKGMLSATRLCRSLK